MRLKVDYYKFNVYAPHNIGGEFYKTLKEAKKAYLQHLDNGHRIGNCIHGCTMHEEDIFLTYTPFYSNTHSFGRTEITNIGRLVRKGVYKFNN